MKVSVTFRVASDEVGISDAKNGNPSWIDSLLSQNVYHEAKMVQKGKHIIGFVEGIEDINIIHISDELKRSYSNAYESVRSAYDRIRNSSDGIATLTFLNREDQLPKIFLDFCSLAKEKVMLETSLNGYCDNCGVNDGRNVLPVYASRIFEFSKLQPVDEYLIANSAIKVEKALQRKLTMRDLSKICPYEGSVRLLNYHVSHDEVAELNNGTKCIGKEVKQHIGDLY